MARKVNAKRVDPVLVQFAESDNLARPYYELDDGRLTDEEIAVLRGVIPQDQTGKLLSSLI